MTERNEIPLLNIGALGLAMLGGPLLVTLLTFWLAYIPVYAVVLGGIPYLVIGTPMALWMALTGPVTVERAMAWAGLTIAVLTVAIGAFAAMAGGSEGVGFILMIGLVSATFGMAWAGTTGWLYGAMTKEKAV